MAQETLITGTRVHLVERAPSSRLRTSYGPAPSVRPHVIVELSAGGITGWGEASPLPEFTGETARTIVTALEETYLPALAGRDPRDIASVMADLEAALPGNPSAKAAVDIALHDLAGRLEGQPVYRLLGGRRRADVALARPIGVMPTADAVELARRFVDLGVSTLKLKIGPDPSSDVERVRAVREAVGQGTALRVDANQGYDLPTALWVLRRLEACDLLYAEQPLPARDLDGLRRLRRQTPVRLMADESVHTPADALTLASERLVDVFALKLIKCGGLRRAVQIAAIGAAAGIASVVVSPFETQIGAAAGLHLAVTLEHAPYAHELTVFMAQPDLAEVDIAVEGARARPAAVPGLGVRQIAELAPAGAP